MDIMGMIQMLKTEMKRWRTVTKSIKVVRKDPNLCILTCSPLAAMLMQDDIDLEEDDLLDEEWDVHENRKEDGVVSMQVVQGDEVAREHVLVEATYSMVNAGDHQLNLSVLDTGCGMVPGKTGGLAVPTDALASYNTGMTSNNADVLGDGFDGNLNVKVMHADVGEFQLAHGDIAAAKGVQAPPDNMGEFTVAVAAEMRGMVEVKSAKQQLRRSSRRASTADEDSIERASRLVAIKKTWK